MTTTHTTSDLSVTTTEHPNANRLRKAFDAFSRGDLDAVRTRLTEDAVWTNGGTSPMAGAHRGWDEISAMFGKLFELTDGTFAMNVLSTLADDKQAVAIYDATSTVNGKTDTQRFVLIEDIDAQGKISAIRGLAYDQEAADAHVNG